MIGIALSLGFFGSLHCIGMCGPLALIACKTEASPSTSNNSIFLYQIGKIITYMILGLLFGLLGEFLFLTNIQKIISISGGVLLIGLVLLSLNIDTLLQKSNVGNKISSIVGKLLLKYTNRAQTKSAFTIGMINGLLPCGLVYLALAGAVLCTNALESSLFMLSFGLGTIPAMTGFLKGFNRLPFNVKRYFNKALPVVTFCFGLFMIYRGVVIDMPMELSFFEAINNPVMCH